MNQRTSIRPVLLGQEHIRKCLSDDRFYLSMPEFSAVRAKVAAAANPNGVGCNTCRKRRVSTSMSGDFMSTLSRLGDDGLVRLKSYLGVPRLLVRMLDRSSGKVVMKEV